MIDKWKLDTFKRKIESLRASSKPLYEKLYEQQKLMKLYGISSADLEALDKK